MALIVMKFGGSSVRDASRLMNAAGIAADAWRAGDQVVVVVSAQGDTTDDLIAKSREIDAAPSRREMDMLLSAGEQISASLLTMAVQKLGCPAASLLGWQAGFQTDSAYGNARIKTIAADRLQAELDRNVIAVVAGFQGINKYDDITTMGRGGSDTSALALAAAFQADRCIIYTDVDGVYTADPRIVQNAVKLPEITYDEMLELATQGAQVLHNRSVEMAKKYNVEIEVRSSLRRVSGTTVKERTTVEELLIKGVTRDHDVARISIVEVKDSHDVEFKIFSRLAQKKINVDIILQSIGRGGVKDIHFTVSRGNLRETLDELNLMGEVRDAKELLWEESICKVSIVGAGMQGNPGVAAKMFEALSDAGINIKMISCSEIKISVLIDMEHSEDAVRAVHSAFIG